MKDNLIIFLNFALKIVGKLKAYIKYIFFLDFFLFFYFF